MKFLLFSLLSTSSCELLLFFIAHSSCVGINLQMFLWVSFGKATQGQVYGRNTEVIEFIRVEMKSFFVGNIILHPKLVSVNNLP